MNKSKTITNKYSPNSEVSDGCGEMRSIYEKRKTRRVEYDEEAVHGVVILVTCVISKG